MNEHGFCPNCGMDFDGDLIWDTFYKQTQSEDQATEKAALFGATRTQGRWGHQIGITDLHNDWITQWKCPECDHVWERELKNASN